jgi:hypothetical protein
MAIFSKNVIKNDQSFALFAFVLSKKRQFFAKKNCENISKIITSVPDWANFRQLSYFYLCNSL